MGLYKNLLIKAQSGNKSACSKVADVFLSNKDIPSAIRWLERAGEMSKAEELRKILNKERLLND